MASFDDWKKLELRVAKVIQAERVENSEKLIKLSIQLTDTNPLGDRQIIAGIGKAYAPEKLIGREIVVIANLEPKKFTIKTEAGEISLESQGMLLAANDNGPVILIPDREVPPGSPIS